MGVLSLVNKGKTVPEKEDYAEYEGTSMAAPHVAGTIAIMRSKYPNLSYEKALDILKSTANPITCDRDYCGAGIIDAAKAMDKVDELVESEKRPSPAPTQPAPSEPSKPEPAPSDSSTPAPAETSKPAPAPTPAPSKPARPIGPPPSKPLPTLPPYEEQLPVLPIKPKPSPSLPSPHRLRLLSRARLLWKPRNPRPRLRSLISQRLLHGGTGTITRVKATTPPAPGTIPGRDTVHGIAGITDTVLGAVGDTTADTVEAGTTPRGCIVQGIRGGHRTPTAGVTATAATATIT